MPGESLWIAVLGGGFISAVLTFLTMRRADKTTRQIHTTDHMEAVAQTLSSFNDRLKVQVLDLQSTTESLHVALEEERKMRRQLARQLEDEKVKTQRLEMRVASLESERGHES